MGLSLETLFQQTILGQQPIAVLMLSFAGGVVSSLLPCTVSMMPLMVGYIGGYGQSSKTEVFFQTLSFVAGLATVLASLGIIASLLGLTFGAFLGPTWYSIIGVVAILMGLQLLNILHLPIPSGLTTLPKTGKGRFIAPFLLGLLFGTVASPCGTPYLAAILGLMSQQKNVLLGGASLFLYAMGQGVLLLAVGMFTGLMKHVATLRRVGAVLSGLSGVVFILVGLLLVAQGTGLWNQILAVFSK
jgi:cytochrome c-type biogenesis protein